MNDKNRMGERERDMDEGEKFRMEGKFEMMYRSGMDLTWWQGPIWE